MVGTDVVLSRGIEISDTSLASAKPPLSDSGLSLTVNACVDEYREPFKRTFRTPSVGAGTPTVLSGQEHHKSQLVVPFCTTYSHVPSIL